MAREMARLERAGFDARIGLATASQRATSNWNTHDACACGGRGLAGAGGAGAVGCRALTAMIEPVTHLAWDTLGARRYPYAEETRPWDEAAFLTPSKPRTRRMHRVSARGRWRVAWRGEIAQALGRAALSHYADFAIARSIP